MKVLPLRNRVFIKKDPEDSTVGESGILFRPDTVKEKTQKGTVLGVGEGYTALSGNFIPTTLKPGQRVFFPKHSGVDTNSIVKGTFLIPEDEVLSVLEDEEEV